MDEIVKDRDLWIAAQSGNKPSIDKIAEYYVPLVQKVAINVARKLPSSIEVGDLISDGYFGLLDAIQKFDPDKGFKFETYATNRIRGEINDQLRAFDWVSRYSRIKFKKVLLTQEALREETQREPTWSQVATRLGWTVEEVLKVQATYNASFSINIDERMKDTTHEFFNLADLVADTSMGDIGYDLEMDEISDEMIEALESLPEREAIVVYLHQIEDMSLADVAKVLEVGAPRISQLYDQALVKLRNFLIRT